jgi:N-methylhydantoinase A/oxoprolinase/acetone carboxylase beta subunit
MKKVENDPYIPLSEKLATAQEMLAKTRNIEKAEIKFMASTKYQNLPTEAEEAEERSEEKEEISDQVIEEQKEAVDNADNLSADSVVSEDEETKIDSADSDLLQEIEDTYNRLELKVQLEDGITRESIDTSPVKTNGQYGEIFTRGLDVKV